MPMTRQKRTGILQLYWTAKQWEEYRAETVTISRALFDQLAMGATLLADGNRPDETCRAAWAEVVEKVKSIETEGGLTYAKARQTDERGTVGAG